MDEDVFPNSGGVYKLQYNDYGKLFISKRQFNVEFLKNI